jgi:hypothetical protein
MSTRKSAKTPVETKPRKSSTQKKSQVKSQAPSREEIAQLAENYWRERGQLDGFAEQDWHRAEQELLAKAS